MSSANGSNNLQLSHLGPYKLVREIARSNDIVYEAIDPAMNRRVAVKELQLPGNLSGEQKRERIERFKREAHAAGTLNHPHIVTIYTVGEHLGHHYIAMEYLDGQSLRQFLQMNGPLPLKRALQIALDMCDALGYAHFSGVVHRDVKPDNIHLVAPNSTAKLTDFGIARVMEEPSLTSTGQVFGTPSYMSPEQLMARQVDHRTDLFSLGITLFEIITGKKPFQGDSVVSVTYAIMNTPVIFPPGMTAGITGILRRAMAKSPDQRYRSAKEMATDLRHELMFMDSPYHQPSGLKEVPHLAKAPDPDATLLVGNTLAQPAIAAPVAQSAPLAPPAADIVPALHVKSSTTHADDNFPQQYDIDSPVGAPPTVGRSNGAVRDVVAGSRTMADDPEGEIFNPAPVGRSLLTLAGAVIGIVVLVAGMIFGIMYTVDTARYAKLDALATKHYNAASIALDQNNPTQAITEYREALRFAPEDDPLSAKSRTNLAFSYSAAGDQVVASNPASAAHFYQQAIMTDGNDAVAHYKLAQISQDPQSQINEYERAITADPNGAVGQQSRKDAAALYFTQGTAALNTHDTTTARNDWNRVIVLVPTDPLAEQARQQMTQAGL